MKKSAVALALVLAAAGGLTLTRGGTPSPKAHVQTHEDGEASESVSPASGQASAMSARDLRLARSFTYAVRSEMALATPEGKELSTTTIGGKLLLTIVGASGGEVTVRGQLLEPAHARRPNGNVRDGAGIGGEFFFFLRPDGTVTGFAFTKSMPGEARRSLRALVADLQIVSGANRVVWETKESDSSGELVASYVRRGETIEKTKNRYDLVRTPQGLVTPASIGATYEVLGGSRATLADHGWPDSVTVHETTTVTFTGMKLAMVEKADAKLVATGERADLVGSFDRARSSIDPDVDGLAESAALAKRNADEGLVNGASFGTLLGDLLAAPDGKTRGRTVARMAALLRVHPEATREARAALLSKDTPELTARNLAAALGDAGTPEAQRALGDALTSPSTSAGVKTESAVSLGLVEKPTAEAKGALAAAAKSSDSNLADTSTLALGNLAKASADNGDTAHDIVDDLLAKLAAAPNIEEKVLALDALGNAGSPRALEAILGFVRDPQNDLRAAAVGALKYLTDARAVEALLVGLHDADTRVRMAGLQAIAQQSVVPYIEGIDRLLQTDGDVQIRMRAVRVAAKSMDMVPELESILGRVSSADPDERVRQLAADALARPRSTASR